MADITPDKNVEGKAPHDSPADGNPVMMGGRAESTSPAAVADGDASYLFVSPEGALVVAGHDGTNPQLITTDASGNLIAVLANEGVDGAAHGASQIGLRVLGTDGSNDQHIIVDGNGRLQITGAMAHGAAVLGNPVLIGLSATQDEPAVVDDGDAVRAWADLFGRQVVLLGHSDPEPPVNVNATTSGNTTVIAAPGAGVSLHICKASIHNSDNSVVTARFEDGTGGTIRWRAELASSGGGSLIDFGSRGWKLTANTLLNVNLSGAGNVEINITDYYIAA